GGKASPVGQQPAHECPRLSGLPELRPVVDHRRVEVQLAALRQQMGANGTDPFARRVHQSQRVPVPFTPGRDISDAAPDIDILAALHIQAERRPHITMQREVSGEGLSDAFVSGLDLSLDVHRSWVLSYRRCRAATPFTEATRSLREG